MVHTPDLHQSSPSAWSSNAGASSAETTSVCVIRVGSSYYGIDVVIVTEFVQATKVLRIPLAPGPVLGLFNMRGSPTLLVSLTALLQSGSPAVSGDVRPALVLRSGELVAAIAVDGVEGVFSLAQGKIRRAQAEGDGQGEEFFEPHQRPDMAVRILRVEEDILAPLRKLKFAPRRGAPGAETT